MPDGVGLYYKRICYNFVERVSVSMAESKIKVPKRKIARLCRKYHIRKLSLFGSVLRDDFRPDSDVDVLVEFEPDHTPGLGFVRIQDELSEIFAGRSVDLVTAKFLNHRIRDRVLREAKAEYDAEG